MTTRHQTSILPLAALFTLVAVWTPLHAQKDESPTAINESSLPLQQAITKALPFIQEHGESWMEDNECMSCHRTSFMVWSHVEAGRSGVKTEQEIVASWIDWNHDNLMSPFPEKDQKHPGEKTIERNLSGASQTLWVASVQPADEQTTQRAQEVLPFVIQGQQKSGAWAPQGQLPGQRRPLPETTQVITMWNGLGLQAAAERDLIDSDAIKQAIEAADKYLSKGKPGGTSEWLALKALWSVRQQRADDAQPWLTQLFKHQHEDGGWGWKVEESSDPLATGQVLFLLHELRRLSPGSDTSQLLEPIERGSQFLIGKQNDDGSWDAIGTKTAMKGDVSETASYWGTCWSTIALSRQLAQQRKSAASLSAKLP